MKNLGQRTLGCYKYTMHFEYRYLVANAMSVFFFSFKLYLSVHSHQERHHLLLNPLYIYFFLDFCQMKA